MLGWPEIIGILIIVLVLFGARKVPELMKGLGQGIKEFKKASREVQDEVQRAIEEEPAPPANSSNYNRKETVSSSTPSSAENPKT